MLILHVSLVFFLFCQNDLKHIFPNNLVANPHTGGATIHQFAVAGTPCTVCDVWGSWAGTQYGSTIVGWYGSMVVQ